MPKWWQSSEVFILPTLTIAIIATKRVVQYMRDYFQATTCLVDCKPWFLYPCVFLESIEPRKDFDKFAHQVGGHQDYEIIYTNGKIYKPMTKEIAFHNELNFYESTVVKKTHSTQCPQHFIPDYYGVRFVRFENRVVRPYLQLRDLTKNFRVPCVCDLKMGRETFEPTSSREKIERRKNKFPYQYEIGYRITGFKTYDCLEKKYHIFDKMSGRSLTPSTISDGLALFFHNSLFLRREVAIAMVQKLENVLSWMLSQTRFKFYCASLLLIYDGAIFLDDICMPSAQIPTVVYNSFIPPAPVGIGFTCCRHIENILSDCVQVSIIDFAHCLPSERGDRDDNFIFGLRNLISHLHEIIIGSQNPSSKELKLLF